MTALRTAQVHLHSLFSDSLLVKAEDKISRSEERLSSGSAHRKPGRFHPYVSSSGRSTQQPDRKPTTLPGSRLETSKFDRKVVVKPQTSPKSRPRVSRSINDNYCVSNVAGVKDSVHVSGKRQDLNPSPVTRKSETVLLHVNSVTNVHSVTGLPQKKGVNPNYCYYHTEIKHVNDVSCVGHFSSANIATNVPTVVVNPPVGARLHQFGEKREALGLSPKVVTILREGYTLPFTNGHKQLCQPTKTVPPSGGTVSADKQKCSRTGNKPKLTGVLQPAIFGTQTQQPVETYPGPEHLEHLPKHRVVQNGDPRDNKNFLTARAVGHLHRLQGRILPHTIHSQSRTYMRFHIQGRSYQFKALLFGLSTAPMEFTVVAKEVKLMALQRGIRTHQYQDDWLVRATSRQICLQHTQTLVALCQELGWLVNKKKSELDPKQVFNFVGYQFDLGEGPHQNVGRP